eukprot:4797947-Pleurochrysis_carterae.AAC.1
MRSSLPRAPASTTAAPASTSSLASRKQGQQDLAHRDVALLGQPQVAHAGADLCRAAQVAHGYGCRRGA